jgi:hypothetical protein
MPRKKDPAAVELGRKGGRKIAKRGSEYFRKLQAKRKHRKGGSTNRTTAEMVSGKKFLEASPLRSGKSRSSTS